MTAAIPLRAQLGGAVEQPVFRDKRNLAMGCQVEGGGHASQTTADDQNVVIIQWGCTMGHLGGLIRLVHPVGKALQREELFSYAPIYQNHSKCAKGMKSLSFIIPGAKKPFVAPVLRGRPHGRYPDN